MYTIKEAAARAGLGVPLVRAWERRYGVVRPSRTAAGYRLYDDAAVETLRTMRHLVRDGWQPSEAARAVLRGDVPAPPEPSLAAERAARPIDAIAPAVPLTEQFVAAAAGFDAAGVERTLDEILARGSFEAVIDDVLLPAVAGLGDAWAAGRLDVAAEHAASAAVLRRLSAAFQAAGRAGGRPVVVGLPPGSRHELGALAFAVAFRRLGVDVLYLGQDVPARSWVDAAAASDAPLAVIGVVTAADRGPALDVAEALAAARPGRLVAFGGAAAPGPGDPPGALRLPAPVVAAARAAAEALASAAEALRQ